MPIRLLLVLTFASFFVQLSAQNGTVRGFVYEEKNGEPVIFTSVYLLGTTYGAATNVDGFFSISKVPVGSYTLMITYVGYDTLQQKVEIKNNGIVSKKLFLKESSVRMEEFVVSAERQEMKKAVYASITKVTPKQMEKLPSMGAEPDLAQYLQVVPGVVFSGDQGGQLYIRGGSPIQNKVLLDGMVIYNPFHSIGLFSVFDADIIRNADIYTGGFNAQYGGRISSVMDVKTRDGNKNRFSGKLSGDTFGAKLLVEGPLIKPHENDGMSLTYVLTGKTSYIDKTSKVLYPHIGDDGLPFGFNDLYGKISLNGDNGSKINVFGFNFNDYVDNYQNMVDLDWTSYGVGSNIVLVPAGSQALIRANIAYSDYYIEMNSESGLPKSSGISGFNMGLSFTYFIGDNQLDYGLELLGFKTDFTFHNDYGQAINQVENTSEFSGFLKYRFNVGNLIIEPGIRLQYYASLSETSIEPRFGLKYKITDKLRFKAAAGLYSQNLIAANSDQDVVNLFYGFLSGPENLQDTFDGKEVTSVLQKSRHLIMGFEYDFTNKMNVNIEGYYKYNPQLTELNRNKLFDDDAINSSQPDILKKDFIIETGKAYGVDFVYKYDYRKFYFWCVYSLGYVERRGEFITDANEVEVKDYNPHYDRRHNVNLMSTYAFGADLNWELGARWNFGSGFPFTPNRGFYERVDFLDGINSDYTKQNGELAYLAGDINSGRLPTYHRFDVSLKRIFYVSDNSVIQVTGSVTNIYNRNNIFYVDLVKNEKVYQLPILPSIGMSWTF